MSVLPPRNTSYFFIPLRFPQRAQFGDLIRTLHANPDWECVHDTITYMLKYVADKLDSRDPRNCQCFHYRLSDHARRKFGVPAADELWSTAPHPYQGESICHRFRLESVQLYCFHTTVCILAFQVSFEDSDPLRVACAQYYLKKVSRERIFPCTSSPAAQEGVTFLSLAQRLADGWNAGMSLDFFYYANPSTERANVFSLVEVAPKEDYSYELYYLRRCYSDGFLYSRDPELESREIYAPSRDVVWGISPEAAACLICPDFGREKFLHSTFVTNFNAQYLFMYVLLLHQKYVLYMFLTIIGVGTYTDLPRLETYQHELYEFETDFVFSCVTEVPQYQNLYNRMVDAFSLKQMYEDVREPLVSLSEVRRADAEAQQQRRDTRLNRSLLLLSLLTFFSALIDSFDFVDSFFSWFFGDRVVELIQICCILLIFLILAYVVISILFNRND